MRNIKGLKGAIVFMTCDGMCRLFTREDIRSSSFFSFLVLKSVFLTSGKEPV